jgi:uncharacterized membrane protein YidH (DUF202 family)
MDMRTSLAEERTNLARERTTLAWQRNRLSELAVLLGTMGLGIAITQVYPDYLVIGEAIMGLAFLGIGYTLYRYLSLKKEYTGKRGR